MRITASLPDHGAVVEAVLEGFVQAACVIISSGVVPPFPQMSGVKYRPEAAGEEVWQLPNQVAQRGAGDCEDLSIWLAAGYRVTGQDPYARCLLVMTGDHQVHCIVELQNGQHVDPSAQARDRERGYEVGVVPNYGIIRDHKGNNPNRDTSAEAEARRKAPPAAASKGTPNPFFVPGLAKWMADNPKWVKDGVLTVTSPKFWDQFGPNVYQSTPAGQERLRAAVLDSPFIEAVKSGQQWAADNGYTIDPKTFGKGERVEVTPDSYGWTDDGHVERYPVLPDPAAEMYDPYGGVLDPYGGVYGSSIFGYDPYADPYAQQAYYGLGPTYESLYDSFADYDDGPLELDAGEPVDSSSGDDVEADVANAVDVNPTDDDAASTADELFGGGWL
jgi:hypothetical protein